MSVPSPNGAESPNVVPAPPRYLYHRQVPAPRSRGRHGPRTADHRRRHGVARQALTANVRTFVVVAACLLILLLLALHILRKSWEIKEARMQAGIPLASSAQSRSAYPAEGGRRREPRRLEEGPPAAAPARPRELDTEALRKATFLAKRGEALEAEGHYVEAIARYREALDLWPSLTPTWARLGRVYLRLGDAARAQGALERAVEGDPGDPQTLNDLGVAYLYQNQIERAREVFEAAAEMDPRFPESHFNTALCHLAFDRRDEAEAAIGRYLRLRPNDPRALKEKAYLDACNGRYADALKALEQALAEAPDWPALHFDAAAASALMGRVADALRSLERAEMLTSPAVAYRVYLQPAFHDVRLSEAGRQFEQRLAERAHALLAEGEALAAEMPATQPMSSVSSPP